VFLSAQPEASAFSAAEALALAHSILLLDALVSHQKCETLSQEAALVANRVRGASTAGESNAGANTARIRMPVTEMLDIDGQVRIYMCLCS